MFQGFTDSIINTFTVEQLVGNLIIAFFCGMIISVIYRRTYRGPHYSTTFVQSMVILSMITSLVIMVIGNNLARAFGLVGAMSIIRFRTAVKDTQDIVFIFFSLAAGMAAGVGLKLLPVVATLLIGAIVFAMHRLNYAMPEKNDLLLQFQCVLEGDESPYLGIIETFCRRNRLVNLQSTGIDDLFELSFHIQLKKKASQMQLIKELNRLPEITNVHLFYDEEHF